MKSMEALKCDFCGGGLIIDDSREFAKCEFCGTKYMKSTLQQKIQEIRGCVKVEGAVETTTGNAEKERLIKNAETLMSVEKYSEAEEIIRTVTNQFPDDYRGWWMLYTLPFYGFINFEKCLAFPVIKHSEELDIAFRITELTEEYKSLWSEIEKVYFAKCDNPLFEFGDLFEDKYPQIPNDSFNRIKENVNAKLDYSKAFVKKMREAINSGNNGRIASVLNSVGLPQEKANEIERFNYRVIGYINNAIIIENLYCSDTEDRFERYPLNRSITYMDMGLCQHCGGTFSGVFSQKCTECGRPKDY